MEKVIIKKEFVAGIKEPWYILYTYDGWANPAVEVYDLRSGEFLALVNSASTGFSRRVFKTVKAACAWAEKKISENFAGREVEFEICL